MRYKEESLAVIGKISKSEKLSLLSILLETMASEIREYIEVILNMQTIHDSPDTLIEVLYEMAGKKVPIDVLQ